MDKLSKSIIDFILKQDHPASCICSMSTDKYSMDNISIADFPFFGESSEDEIQTAIKYLVTKGFAEYCYLTLSSGKQIAVSFKLSHMGLHKKEFDLLSKKEKWKERLWGFFSGIAVSVISGVIIWLISK